MGADRAGGDAGEVLHVAIDTAPGQGFAVAAGGTLLQPGLTDRLLQAAAERPAPVVGIDRPDPLTNRELDILRLLAAGYSNREIAAALYLSTGTVKNHVSNVLLKLGVRDRTRAVLRALDLGLLGPA